MHFAQSELVYHRGKNAKKSGTYGNQAARFLKIFLHKHMIFFHTGKEKNKILSSVLLLFCDWLR